MSEVSLRRYRYCGKERDEETGLNYQSARYYALWLCRWIAVDPIFQENYNHFKGNGGRVRKQGVTEFNCSAYEYCYCNPIRFTDNAGEQTGQTTTRPEKKKGVVIDPTGTDAATMTKFYTEYKTKANPSTLKKLEALEKSDIQIVLKFGDLASKGFLGTTSYENIGEGIINITIDNSGKTDKYNFVAAIADELETAWQFNSEKWAVVTYDPNLIPEGADAYATINYDRADELETQKASIAALKRYGFKLKEGTFEAAISKAITEGRIDEEFDKNAEYRTLSKEDKVGVNGATDEQIQQVVNQNNSGVIMISIRRETGLKTIRRQKQ